MITQENIPYTADEIKAMVKTCEKYNKALEKARELMNKGYDVLMPEIFPELQESKEDKIMRVIRGWIYTQPSEFFDGDFSKEEMLAWVEKQGEKKPAENVKALDADKVIAWMKNTIKQRAENYGVYKETHLILPYNSIEDLINDFKEDFGL